MRNPRAATGGRSGPAPRPRGRERSRLGTPSAGSALALSVRRPTSDQPDDRPPRLPAVRSNTRPPPNVQGRERSLAEFRCTRSLEDLGGLGLGQDHVLSALVQSKRPQGAAVPSIARYTVRAEAVFEKECRNPTANLEESKPSATSGALRRQNTARANARCTPIVTDGSVYLEGAPFAQAT